MKRNNQNMKLNSTLIGATIVAALGGLLFGFDTVIISGAQTQLKEIFQLDGFMQGFMVASALIGTIIGSLIAGKPADVYGRRDSSSYLCEIAPQIQDAGIFYHYHRNHRGAAIPVYESDGSDRPDQHRNLVCLYSGIRRYPDCQSERKQG